MWRGSGIVSTKFCEFLKPTNWQLHPLVMVIGRCENGKDHFQLLSPLPIFEFITLLHSGLQWAYSSAVFELKGDLLSFLRSISVQRKTFIESFLWLHRI